jgi:branched-chain amino acid transport system ATP-binding protein
MSITNDPALLSLRNVTAGYGGSVAIEDICLDVKPGEVVCLLGANGAGKTTTMAAITGLIGCTGQVVFDGRALGEVAAADRVPLGIALSPEGRKVFPNLSVYENLLLGGYNRMARMHRKQKLEEVYALFPRLNERRGQAAGLMSGGEQQMLAIGRALMACPKLLLLDEPSLGLAPKVVLQMFDAIAKIAAANVSILLVEQNAHAAFSVAHRGYLLSAGRIVYSDTVANLRDHDIVREAFLGKRGSTRSAQVAPLTTGICPTGDRHA